MLYSINDSLSLWRGQSRKSEFKRTSIEVMNVSIQRHTVRNRYIQKQVYEPCRKAMNCTVSSANQPTVGFALQQTWYTLNRALNIVASYIQTRFYRANGVVRFNGSTLMHGIRRCESHVALCDTQLCSSTYDPLSFLPQKRRESTINNLI